MRDESTKQAAQEYLATRLTEEQQRYEDEQNRATAIARSTARRLKLWQLERWAEATDEKDACFSHARNQH